jgi:integrase
MRSRKDGTLAQAPQKRRLTELLVKRQRPADAPYLIWDTKQAGLVLRVQPSGHRSWYCVYRHHARPRWHRLGNVDAIGLADARMLAAEIMLQAAKGLDPAAEKKAERSRGTFEELATRYVEEHAKRHNKSWRQADALVRRHLIPKWGKLQAASISRSDVKAVMARIEAPVVANQTLSAASAVFTWAMKEELIASNPCRGVDRNPTKSRERVLADSEVPLFWKAFDDAGLVVGSALKAILLTGQRPGEVAHMRREHNKDGWWEMPGETVQTMGWPGTKNAQAHRVWLPASVQALLAEMGDAATGFVFAGPRRRAVRGLDEAMRSICTKLGVERVTPHDLRRTFSTTVTGLGFGRDALNRVTNHREGGIASVYDRHGYADENKRVMEATAARIMALVEGGVPRDQVVPFPVKSR